MRLRHVQPLPCVRSSGSGVSMSRVVGAVGRHVVWWRRGPARSWQRRGSRVAYAVVANERVGVAGEQGGR